MIEDNSRNIIKMSFLEDGDLEFSNQELLSGTNIGDVPSSDSMDSFFDDSMDSFFDELLRDTHACTHTHTWNPPGPDLTHTHTCFHVHTKNVDEIVGNTGTINLSSHKQGELLVTDLTDKVHHLPCCIKYTGPTDVSHYFKPKSTGVEVDGLEVKEAFFRGRKLQGVSVKFPEGYSGFVLGKKKSTTDKANKTAGRCKALEISNGIENSWEMLAKCSNMTFWNHDNLPSQDDASLRLFHLFAVANAVHEPLSTEDLNFTSVAKIQNS